MDLDLKGIPKSEVTDTRDLGKYVRRLRKSTSGEVFTTYEISSTDFFKAFKKKKKNKYVKKRKASKKELEKRELRKARGAKKRKAILEAYDKNHSCKEISEKTNITYSYVYKVLKSQGLHTVKNKRPNSKEESILKIDFYNHTAKEIAEKLGTTVKYIYFVLKKHGVNCQKMKSNSKSQKILQLDTEKFTRQEIARKVGASIDYVSIVMKKYNLKSKPCSQICLEIIDSLPVENMTINEIVKSSGYSKPQISKLLIKHKKKWIKVPSNYIKLGGTAIKDAGKMSKEDFLTKYECRDVEYYAHRNLYFY